MTETLRQLGTWYRQRQRREQVLLLLALLVIVVLVWNYAVLVPLEHRGERAQARIAEHENALAEIAEQRTDLIARQDDDPDAPWRERLDEARETRAELEAELDEQMQRLVSPSRMVAVLRRMLAEQEGLELESLQTRPPEAVFDEDDLRVYRHGVTVVFKGSYSATRDYLERLETDSRELIWERVDYQVVSHPRARVRLDVHTLSLEEPTLGL